MELNEFEQMAQSLRPRIVALALGITTDDSEAEDVAQETLLKMWSIRDRLDSYRSVESLAIVVARHKAVDILRRRAASTGVGIEEIELPDPGLTPEESIVESETDNEADSLLAMLPEGQRIVLKMKHIDGLEVEEIARLTGSNPNAIRVTLSRARHRVKEIFMNRNLSR